MQTDQKPAKAYVIAITFGMGDTQQVVCGAEIAPHEIAATAMAVSRAHQAHGVTQLLTGISISQLTDDFIERARRGFGGAAPVVSLVPQAPPQSCEHAYATIRDNANPIAPMRVRCQKCGHEPDGAA